MEPNLSYTKEDIKGYECVFATYAEDPENGSDALIVKENIHLHDGRTIPNIRIFKDYQWPFWITRKGFRNHEDQKEYEDLDKLQMFKSTRINLPKKIVNALDVYSARNSLRDLSESPYLYGTDILPTSLIKHKYQTKWPDCNTLSKTVAGFDIETDMRYPDSKIPIMANLTFAGKSYTAVTEDYANSEPNFIQRCHAKAKELAPDDFNELNWVIEIVPTPGEACFRCIQKAHEWKPDFISVWNIDFDIPIVIKHLQDEGYDLAQVFSDPKVPDQFKFFEYVRGPSVKVNRLGKKTPIHMADRWHICTTPASFYFIDGMCLYKRIRVAEGNLPSYKLDSVLELNELPAKLKIDELETIEKDGELWHTVMQRDYKIEYTVYNAVDDIRLIDLDNKTGDIARAFGSLAGISDFKVFHRNPRRIADDLHFFYQGKGKIVGSTSPKLDQDPLDAMVSGMSDWIVTLPSFLINNGMYLFEDAPHLRTFIYRYLSDLDISSTYPTGEDICNISKETTLYETIGIEGMSETQKRMFSINLTGGKSNALELAIRYFNMPAPHQLLEQYRADKQK